MFYNVLQCSKAKSPETRGNSTLYQCSVFLRNLKVWEFFVEWRVKNISASGRVELWRYLIFFKKGTLLLLLHLHTFTYIYTISDRHFYTRFHKRCYYLSPIANVPEAWNIVEHYGTFWNITDPHCGTLPILVREILVSPKTNLLLTKNRPEHYRLEHYKRGITEH